MTIEEAWNRGNNLVACATVAIAGFAFFPEVFTETEPPFKIDDILLFLLGIGAIVWYKKNRYARSIVPIVFTSAAFLIKLGAIFVEFSQKDDVGDDFGGTVLFLLITVFSVWLYCNIHYKVLDKQHTV